MEMNSNEARQDETVTLTLRLIRSFEFSNMKPIVIRNVSLDMTTEELQELTNETVKKSTTLPMPFRNYAFDCLKIECQAFGAKTNDPLINTENDEKLILQPNCSLGSQGIKNETELTYFKKADYLSYKESKLKSMESD